MGRHSLEQPGYGKLLPLSVAVLAALGPAANMDGPVGEEYGIIQATGAGIEPPLPYELPVTPVDQPQDPQKINFNIEPGSYWYEAGIEDPTACRQFHELTSPELARSLAGACLAMYQGEVPVANFGVDTELAEASLQMAEDDLRRASGGLIDVDFELVEADAAAVAQAASAADCDSNMYSDYDMHTIATYAAHSARETMPQLADAQAVLALRSDQICGSPSALGVAKLDSNVADIEAYREDGTSYEVHETAFTIGHEYLHLLGLGHAGTLQGSLPGESWTEDLEGLGITLQTGSLDLPAYVASAPETMNVYGDFPSLMGGNAPDATEQPGVYPELSAVQMQTLEAPQRSLDGLTGHSPESAGTAVVLTMEDVQNDGLAMIRLRDPLYVPETRYAYGGSYQGLAVVPVAEGSVLNGFSLVLVNDDNEYLSLGTVYGDKEMSTFAIELADGTVSFELNKEQLIVIDKGPSS